MDILEDLYYGNLISHEKVSKLDDETKELLGCSTEMKKSSLQLFPMSKKKTLKNTKTAIGKFLKPVNGFFITDSKLGTKIVIGSMI